MVVHGDGRDRCRGRARRDRTIELFTGLVEPGRELAPNVSPVVIEASKRAPTAVVEALSARALPPGKLCQRLLLRFFVRLLAALRLVALRLPAFCFLHGTFIVMSRSKRLPL